MTHLVVGTAGHIDHGKSTLVHALTGTDPDRLKEEKARGITIDLGFAHWRHGDLTVALVDVPGHERFVKNMLAGVGGIDAVLLVVAADEGVMPQTREHLDICRLLAIPRGVVVLTKADLVEAEMLALVRLEVAELIAGTPIEAAPIIAVSARTGAGLAELRSALVALAPAAGVRESGGRARLPIDRVFTMRGFGTVVTGTLVSGSIADDQELEVVPGDRRLKVRGLQVHGASRRSAVAGERVAVNIAGAEVSELARGQVLTAPGTLSATQLADAVVEVLPGARALRHGARVRFHQGTVEVLARVSVIAAPPAGDEVLAIPAGGRGPVRLRMESPTAITRGDRFVLRSYSPAITIAGGRVLDPAPPAGGVRVAATLARFEPLVGPFDRGADEADALLVFVAEAGARGLALGDLVWRGGCAGAAGEQAVARLVAREDVWRVGDKVLLSSWRGVLETRALAAIAAHHAAQPLSAGIPREELREGILGDAGAEVADEILGSLEKRGRIRGRERIALPGQGVSLSSEETAARDRVANAYQAAGLTPPDQDALVASIGVAAAVVRRVMQLLVRERVLVRVDTLLFHAEALARLRADVAGLKTTGQPAHIDVARFKDRYGLSRKYAIPLLEYLDRERVTRRLGDVRVVL